MAIEFNEENGGKILVVHVTREAGDSGLRSFVPSSSGSSGCMENCMCCST